MNHISLLYGVGLAAAMGVPVSTGAAEPRPNIILVMCDDLGWGDVGFNGIPSSGRRTWTRWRPAV